ncbi:divergent polysaccharide deacetylase family protein [Litoreibacter albidus]|uniref:divergent polysaccharide deacetylase family protein n=1 Tax=Litoreibacter albidus TaxID=670155 RepID=UPI003735BBDF
MGKGIGAGIASGGFVGAVVLTMLSLYAPLPQDRIDAAPKLAVQTATPQAVAPTDTDSTEAPQASNDAKITATDDAAPAQASEPSATVQPSAPEASADATFNADSPTAEIASSAARADGFVPDPAIVHPKDDDIVVASADPVPTPLTQADRPAPAPTADAAPSVPASADNASPKVTASQLESPTVIGTEQVEVDTTVPDAPSLPTITAPDQDSGSVDIAAADTPITLPSVVLGAGSGVITNRLPSLGDDNAVAAPAPGVTGSNVDPEEMGALRAYGQRVEGAEGKSLFGVVLIDSGAEGIARADLMKLSVPVTIAIDPTAPNATQIMQDYRDAGMEVVAIANELPTASSPSDVAVAVEAYFDLLPQAVGIMDPLDGRIQSNRTLLQPVLGAIRSSGHGLITYDRGLNTAQQAARREDIPAATVFRVLDADLEEAPKIKRYLDRAAFNANRDGSVVVVGRSYPETVKAIVEWVLEKKESGIAMVPVSAVMLADEAS